MTADAASTTEATAREHDVAIEVRGASVTFHMDRGTSRVLNDINLDIQREESIGIVGESGSGKSMFASSLIDAVIDPGELTGSITYYPRDGGEVDVLELSDAELKQFRWEEIAFVVQGAQSAFNPTMTIGEHFEETLNAHDADVDEGLERGRDLLTELYLDPETVMQSYSHELSGGMKQRALLALSLVLKPDILVLDEPTAALDLLMQRSIISLLADIKEEYDLTVVFVTHDLPLVADLADRIAVMYAFEFAEIGPVERVVERAAHPYTRALINSVPNIETPATEIKSIEGSSPDPVNVPTGCSYHPRCPLADENCEVENPDHRSVDEDRTVACFHWERVDDVIPLITERGEE